MSQVEKDRRAGARLKMRAVLENAKAAGFRPASIIDVGFATGTTGLHDVWDDVRRLIIEPVAEAEPTMIRFCQEHPGASYEVAAASDAPGQRAMAVRPAISNSSFHVKLKGDHCEARMIPLVTLDELVVKHDLPGPYLLKMDVEGHELHVLRGALETCLPRTEMVIAEVGTWLDARPKGRASMMDVFRFMEDHGFSFYDIIEPAYRPLDGALYMFEAVFVRPDSILREKTSVRTAEQAAENLKVKQARADAALSQD